MAKEICISSTPHETRLAILENDQLAEIYYERENEYTLAGSIYKGRVTRVLPGMQSAFVDLGLERDAFLYVTDFLEEQEDGADFESTTPAGNGHARREGGQQPREPREPRPPRQESAPRTESAPREEASGDSDSSEDSDSPSGTRRWRGRRGRRRGFRGRGPQDEQQRDAQQHEAQAPSSPTLEDFETVEEAIAVEPVARPERGAPGGIPTQHLPIVLPGESLSKYGGVPAPAVSPSVPEEKPQASAKAAPGPKVNYVAPKPSTQVEVPAGWDGGALLPGESLSRYRRRESVSAAPQEAFAVAETAHEVSVPVFEPAFTEPGPHQSEALAEALTAEPAEEATPAPQHEVAVHLEAEPAAHLPETTPIAEVSAPEASAPEPAAPEIISETVFETIEEVHEFEPEEASASYRVDPAAPSEFRFGTPVEEEVISSEDHPESREEVHASAEEVPPSVQESAGVAETEEAEPAHAASAVSPEAEAVDQLYGFAPGLGVLEEEVIEEEEYDFEPIHTQSDEQEIEDLEEETLDHAGDIGDAVRDAHLDQRLGLDSPSEDESDEEDLDESEENGIDTDFAEAEEDEDLDEESDEHESHTHAEAGSSEAATPQRREGQRESGRRGDRRGGRGRHQGGGRRHQGGGGGRRPSMQTQDLPIISELLKQGQEILVQIAKEPIAKKGARITSHIALPGRFLVFMPTVNHVGVSRKISSDEERQRLKRILISEKGTETGGFIVRTAADGASEDELRADLRFLLNLWREIKQRADEGKAPALIYHDLNLVERILRDQVSDNFSAIWVDSEVDYERIVRFLNRFQPSLVRRVKLYTKETPLFEQFGIQEEISKALKSKVWLKSGGSIVINQTEALVAIDINTGKYVGKTARLEDTIVKTNLDAIPEIVRQIRLRDLGGIIVIDFIDMDERKNRHRVLQALEEELKSDRAPSKVLQFNDFGLVAITRKRVKQSLERTLSIPCPTCTATGMVKSPITVANEIYTEMRRMQRHFERGDVLLRVNPEVVKTLKAGNARWLNELEEMTGKTIIVKSDPALHPEQFDIH